MNLFKLLLYTFCLFPWSANLTTVDDQLSGEISNIAEEDGGINLRVGRGSSTIDKVRMVRSNTTKYNKPKFFRWLDDNFYDNLDIVFEDKKREDAYKRTAAENSPHSVMLTIIFDKAANPLTCSGTLLTQSLVLTAAHCLFKDNIEATSVTVYAGGNAFVEIQNGQPAKGSQQQVSTKFHLFPSYKAKHVYDVAVVRTPRPFDLTKTVNIVNISEKPWKTEGYKECTFTGFGLATTSKGHKDDHTRKTHELKIESPCRCAANLQKLLKAAVFLCSKPMEDYGICAGDSGGGLICDGEVRGIALFANTMTNAKTCEMDDKAETVCGDKNTISIFQHTYLVRNWIKTFMKPSPNTRPPAPMVSHSQAPTVPYSPTPTTPTVSHGCNIKLATNLLTLSMIVNIF